MVVANQQIFYSDLGASLCYFRGIDHNWSPSDQHDNVVPGLGKWQSTTGVHDPWISCHLKWHESTYTMWTISSGWWFRPPKNNMRKSLGSIITFDQPGGHWWEKKMLSPFDAIDWQGIRSISAVYPQNSRKSRIISIKSLGLVEI